MGGAGRGTAGTERDAIEMRVQCRGAGGLTMSLFTEATLGCGGRRAH